MFEKIAPKFKGDIYTDKEIRLLYATDASAYRELPLAVCRPRDEADIKILIDLANEHQIPLIPRTAGTSLAGQVVGSGIIVDVSKYFTKILEINEKEKYVWVQPGVILDELNLELKSIGLFFGPETSTSSRCMIGGMVGNNSCGAHSLVYGSTRDHTLALKCLLSDGSEAEFKALDQDAYKAKMSQPNFEGKIYKQTHEKLYDKRVQEEILTQFPDPELERRNTGYALDLLIDNAVFGAQGKFNFCNLLAGSEGTLAFTTAIKLNLVDLPPKHKALVCIHLDTVIQAAEANVIALEYQPASIELMDKKILDLTRKNRLQDQNRFFVQGDPGAILIVEFAENHADEINAKAEAMEQKLRGKGLGYYFPMVHGSDIKKVWSLRKAGLGILANMPGDAKPAPVIEDTAVNPKVLPQYLKEFDAILEAQNLECVYYAHIATGELHLRPIINLKSSEGVKQFRAIAEASAKLVKKYRGSLSGEHGDGRLRGEFIASMVGEQNYRVMEEMKALWDPKGIFNPGKITHTPPMDTFLRYEPDYEAPKLDTIFDYSSTAGYLRAIEKCNGTGDCRKTSKVGGVMCPSYMATLDEQNSTRARANTLREFLSHPPQKDPFNSKEIYQSLDLCLSCKACKSECPSNVDMTKYKAEFLQHYYDANRIPIRTLMIAYIHKFNALGMIWPAFYNFFLKNKAISTLIKKSIGFAPKRSIPILYRQSMQAWIKAHPISLNNPKGKLMLFVDEFTNYNDVEIGIKAVKLLWELGYQVDIAPIHVSGRTFLSKGLLRKAQAIAQHNVEKLADKVSDDYPLVGIEPSAILGFRDEYPELLQDELQQKAKDIGKNALLFEEFIMREVEAKRISEEQFTQDSASIKLHGHCHQKAIATTKESIEMLKLPKNYNVEEIPSGCCGMAGSFGYEKEHYDLSMKVGEMVLFPSVRASKSETIIAAPGTSCRHQIKDGTGKIALHPIEVLYNALRK